MEEKIKILREKEARIRDLKTSSSKDMERANVAWRQHATVYRHPNHPSRRNSNGSNASITDVAFEYYYCGSTEYFVANCEF